MNCTESLPVYGNSGTDCVNFGEAMAVGRPLSLKDGPRQPTHFARIVFLHREYENILVVLRALDGQRESARAYLRSPGRNPVLALSRLRQIRRKRNLLSERIQANRAEALAMLAMLDRDAA